MKLAMINNTILRKMLGFVLLVVVGVSSESSATPTCLYLSEWCEQCLAGNCSTDPCSITPDLLATSCVPAHCLQLSAQCLHPDQVDKRGLGDLYYFLLRTQPSLTASSTTSERYRRKGSRLSSEFLGKRSELLGKRALEAAVQESPSWKRSELLGKRVDTSGETEDKRNEFLGKRGSEFLGKRGEFLGKRDKNVNMNALLGLLKLNQLDKIKQTNKMETEIDKQNKVGSSEVRSSVLAARDARTPAEGFEDLQRKLRDRMFKSRPRIGSEFLGKRGESDGSKFGEPEYVDFVKATFNDS